MDPKAGLYPIVRVDREIRRHWHRASADDTRLSEDGLLWVLSEAFAFKNTVPIDLSFSLKKVTLERCCLGIFALVAIGGPRSTAANQTTPVTKRKPKTTALLH